MISFIGVEYTHLDLFFNYVCTSDHTLFIHIQWVLIFLIQDSGISTDICGQDSDPSPGPSETHATAVAGEIVSVKSNAVCGTGVAYNAIFGGKYIVHQCILLHTFQFTPVGIRLIACPVSDFDIADALTHRNDIVDIYSNSWGPSGNGNTVGGPGPVLQMVLQTAVEQVICHIYIKL